MAIFKGQLRPHIWVAAHMVTIQEFRERTRRGRNRGGGRVDELLPVPKNGMSLWRSQSDVTFERDWSKPFWVRASNVNIFLVFEMSHFFPHFSALKIYLYHKHAVLGMKFWLPEGERAQASQGSMFHREGRTNPSHASKPLSVFQWLPRHFSDVIPSCPPFACHEPPLAFSVSLGASLLPKPSLRI